MYIDIIRTEAIQPSELSLNLRCPSCHHLGTLEQLAVDDMFITTGNDEEYIVGSRSCPNRDCNAHIFFVWDPANSRLEATYPPERIDFDATDVPPAIVKSFEEAITCHANECFAAAAIMIRRTLEDLCHDRGAAGDNLYERIEALKDSVVLPKELLDGLHDIRLLGNDAAHVESKTYEQVGSYEVELLTKFTKEVLKAVYQYSSLINQMAELKRPTEDSGTAEE